MSDESPPYRSYYGIFVSDRDLLSASSVNCVDLNQHGNGIADSLLLGSGNLDVQVGLRTDSSDFERVSAVTVSKQRHNSNPEELNLMIS
jgi:hypothetical protein